MRRGENDQTFGELSFCAVNLDTTPGSRVQSTFAIALATASGAFDTNESGHFLPIRRVF